MNSPPEPASPISSESSDSPFNDEAPALAISSGPPASSSSANKRRHPAGPGAPSSARDSKSRRRDEASSRRSGPGGGGAAYHSEQRDGDRGARQKEEFIDVGLSEQLKRKIGDPFDEEMIKNVA